MIASGTRRSNARRVTAGAKISGQVVFVRSSLQKNESTSPRVCARAHPPQLMVCTMGRIRTVFGQAVALLGARRGSKGRRALRRLWGESAAVTSVEYAVMLALILGVILISIKLLGTNTKALWTSNSSSLQSAGLGGS